MILYNFTCRKQDNVTNYEKIILVTGGQRSGKSSYARKETESKAKVVYTGMSIKEKVISLLGGIIPLYFFPMEYGWALISPVVVFLFLMLTTADCFHTWPRQWRT